MLTKLLQDIGCYLEAVENESVRIEHLNTIRRFLKKYSPFQHEPVDCIEWLPTQSLLNNSFNPNVMARTEKNLLRDSLLKNGFTQPIVAIAIEEDKFIVDGHHRCIAASSSELYSRLRGYVPVSLLDKHDDLVTASIRHNRARGTDQIQQLSAVVRNLVNRGWSDLRIGTELGMDADEVLRLRQLNGLLERFTSETYSEAWTVR